MSANGTPGVKTDQPGCTDGGGFRAIVGVVVDDPVDWRETGGFVGAVRELRRGEPPGGATIVFLEPNIDALGKLLVLLGDSPSQRPVEASKSNVWSLGPGTRPTVEQLPVDEVKSSIPMSNFCHAWRQRPVAGGGAPGVLDRGLMAE